MPIHPLKKLLIVSTSHNGTHHTEHSNWYSQLSLDNSNGKQLVYTWLIVMAHSFCFMHGGKWQHHAALDFKKRWLVRYCWYYLIWTWPFRYMPPAYCTSYCRACTKMAKPQIIVVPPHTLERVNACMEAHLSDLYCSTECYVRLHNVFNWNIILADIYALVVVHWL